MPGIYGFHHMVVRLEDFDTAMAHLSKAIAFNPRHTRARQLRIYLNYTSGLDFYPRALKDCHEILQIDPDNSGKNHPFPLFLRLLLLLLLLLLSMFALN